MFIKILRNKFKVATIKYSDVRQLLDWINLYNTSDLTYVITISRTSVSLKVPTYSFEDLGGIKIYPIFWNFVELCFWLIGDNHNALKLLKCINFCTYPLTSSHWTKLDCIFIKVKCAIPFSFVTGQIISHIPLLYFFPLTVRLNSVPLP